MGLFSFIGKAGKAFTGAPKYKIPNYQQFAEYAPSQYDAPSSKQLFQTYSRRAAGKDVGFDPGELATMRSQAIDEAQRVGSVLERRGMAGRKMTGGLTTGGISRLREKGILATQLARSDSLRDIALRNAVLKREETWQGIGGLDKFLQNERTDAYQRTRFSREKTSYGNELLREQSSLDFQNQRNQYQKSLERWGLFSEFEEDIYGPYSEGFLGGGRSKASKGASSSSDYDYGAAFPKPAKSLSRYRA